MSRKARDRAKKLPHHIMSQCIQELMLFNTDEDKEYYLNLIKMSSRGLRMKGFDVRH